MDPSAKSTAVEDLRHMAATVLPSQDLSSAAAAALVSKGHSCKKCTSVPPRARFEKTTGSNPKMPLNKGPFTYYVSSYNKAG